MYSLNKPRIGLPPRGHVFTTEDMESGASGSSSCSPASAAAPLMAPAGASGPNGGGCVTRERLRLLHRQLDSFMPSDKFLGQYELLGRWERREGGAVLLVFTCMLLMHVTGDMSSSTAPCVLHTSSVLSGECSAVCSAVGKHCSI